MTSLTNEVKGLFQPRSDLLELRKEAARALNTDEWKAYKKVVEKIDGERRITKRQFELEYTKNDLTRIDQKECEELRPMLENAQARVEQREKPIKDFQKAVDRRSGQDRRVRSWSR